MVQFGIEAAQGAGIGCVSRYAPMSATPRTSIPGKTLRDGRGMSLSSVSLSEFGIILKEWSADSSRPYHYAHGN